MFGEDRAQVFPALCEHARLVRMEAHCALVNRLNGRYILLDPPQAAVVAMCNGSMSLERILSTAAGFPSASGEPQRESILEMLERCRDFFDWHDQAQMREWKYYPPDFLYVPRRRKTPSVTPLEKPLIMTLVLTNRCNLRCIYCFRAGGAEWADELPTEDIFRLVDQAAEMEIKHCSVTGGEPALHPDFTDIVVRLLERDIYPYISTNGTCTAEAALSRLRDAGLETLQVSLDAGTAEVHDRMVGRRGSFDAVLGTIRTAKNLGYALRVKGVVTRVNAGSVGDLLHRCRDLGVDGVYLEAYSPGLSGRGDRTLLLSRRLALQVRAAVERARETFPDGVSVAPFTVPEKWTGAEDIIYCGGMWTAFVVQPDGSVCACEQVNDDRLRFGNIRERPLSEIWGSRQVLEFLNPDPSLTPEPCGTCQHFARCRSGCFNFSLQYSNDLYAPDPRCWKATLGRDDPLMLVERPARAPCEER